MCLGDANRTTCRKGSLLQIKLAVKPKSILMSISLWAIIKIDLFDSVFNQCSGYWQTDEKANEVGIQHLV